jgi:WD40 repeat protein
MERATFKGHTFPVNQTALSPDGKLLASGGGDINGSELKLWDAATGKEIASIPDLPRRQNLPNRIYAVVFSPDGKTLAAGGSSAPQTWEVATRKKLAIFPDTHDDAIKILRFRDDGKQLAGAAWDRAWLWDVASAKTVASFERKDRVTPRLALSPDLRTLAGPSYEEIDLWDMAQGKTRVTLSGHRGYISCLAYSPNGKTLLGASALYYGADVNWRGDLKLWDAATGKERTTLKGPFGQVNLAMFSPDGKRLALLESPDLYTDPHLKLLEMASGQQRTISSPPACVFNVVTFTADGRLFVIGAVDDKILKLWEVLLPEKI